MSQKAKVKLVFLVHEGSAQTNLKAVEKAITDGVIDAQILCIVSDKDSLPDFNKISPDYICLAGWKKIIPDKLVTDYKILNMHPGLIPESLDGKVENPDGTEALWNKGMYADKAIGNFLNKKSTYAGSTLHFLTSDFDFGPVLGRTFEKVLAGDTVETLYTRLKKKENELYVEALSKLTKNDKR